MESYVIHIYRRPTDRSEVIIGTVEQVSLGIQIPFRGKEELWTILSGTNKTTGRLRKARKKANQLRKGLDNNSA
jgi:hypothetical protein